MKKNYILAALGLVVLVGAALLITLPAETGAPVKVGVILPLTGDSAKYGEPAKQVMDLALKEANARSGQDIELIFEDGKCKGLDAVNAFQKLVQVDGVQVVIGGFCSGESHAIVPLAEKAKVALLSPGSTSPKLTGISQYFARNYPSAATQGSVLAEIAYTDKGWRRVAFIQEQTDYAVGVRTAFADTFIKLGGAVTVEEFPSDTTDFRTLVVKARAVDADALFIDAQNAAGAARILAEMQTLGWKPPLILSNIIVADAQILTERAAQLEDALAAEFNPDPANSIFASLRAAYQTAHGVELPYQSYAQAEYDAVFLVREAIGAVGNSGEAVAAHVRSIQNWSGASGTFSIGTDGDPTLSFEPLVVQGGSKVPYVSN